jgi:hypothetical protein
MLFSLIFTVSGVSFVILSDVSVHTCVGRLIYERAAIVAVNSKHPDLIMNVECKPQNLNS